MFLEEIMGKKFTFIDLFAGIGGIRTGFERAGARCVFSSEWDEYCQNMYEANFGERPVGDITKVLADDIPDHDILTAGFPCQSFSVIGNRLGFADTRGTLFFEIERILRVKKPQAFLLENVKQLVSHDQRRTFTVILDKLNRLGYYVHYKVLNALNFGVPQKRERIIIVGFLENYPFKFPDREKRKFLTLDDVLEPNDRVDKKYFITKYFEGKLKKKVKTRYSYRTIWHENKSGNIGIHPYSCALRANGSHNYLLVDGVRRLTPREMLRLQGFPEKFRIMESDFQVKKQAGNSVTVPKISAVAQAMVYAMKQKPVLITPKDLFEQRTLGEIYEFEGSSQRSA